MEKKKTVGILGALLVAIAGDSYALNLDFSSTTTTTIGGDIDLTDSSLVNNYVLDNYGVDIDEFKKMCEEGILPQEARVFCRLIGA